MTAAAALGLLLLLGRTAAAAVQPGAMGDGLEAQRLLGAGLDTGSPLEKLHASGAKAELAFQGARAGHDERAVAAGEAGFESLRRALPGADPKTPALHVSEPPAPGRPGGQDPPPKPKRDWLKLVQKWLPVAMVLAASVQMILNPVGTATFWVRNLALIAGIGTIRQLIREIRGK